MPNYANKIDIEAVEKEINKICSEFQAMEFKFQAAYIQDYVVEPDDACSNVLVLRDLIKQLQREFKTNENFSETLTELYTWVFYNSKYTLELYGELYPKQAGKLASDELAVRFNFVHRLAMIQVKLNDAI